jgi:hypothetical protein
VLYYDMLARFLQTCPYTIREATMSLRDLLGPLADAWTIAEHWAADDYREAIAELAAHPHKLPGAVFVRLPDGGLEDPVWRGIVQSTVPLCTSGLRRLVKPTRSRHQFLPSPLGPMHVMQDYDLEIGPWGGDADSAYIRLRVSRNWLIGRHWPHAAKPRSPHGIPSLTEDSSSSFRTDDMLFELADTTLTKGHAMKHLDHAAVPMYAIVKVSPGDGLVYVHLDEAVAAVGPVGV